MLGRGSGDAGSWGTGSGAAPGSALGDQELRSQSPQSHTSTPPHPAVAQPMPYIFIGLFLPDPIEMGYEGSRSGLASPWGQIVSAPQLGDTSHGGGRWIYPHPSPPPISLPRSLGSQHDFPRGFMDLFPAGLWMRLEGAAQPPLPLPITPPCSPPRGALRCQALISSPPPPPAGRWMEMHFSPDHIAAA